MKKSNLPIIIVAVLVVGYLVFFARPADNQNGTVVQLSPTPANGAPIDTSDWKIYRNAGIELEYPSTWTFVEGIGKTLGVNPPQDILQEIRFTGDGYTFIINPNGGFGEGFRYNPVQVKIGDQIIDNAGEQIGSDGIYHLAFIVDRPNSNNFYLFRINFDRLDQISITIAKSTIFKILESVKFY